MNANYTLILNGKTITEVGGTEYAYEAWARMKELAGFLGVPAFLVSNDDSEIVAEYDPEVVEESDSDAAGFDVCGGWYTRDC